MNDLNSGNFGLLISYVLPGMTVLWALSYLSPAVGAWLTDTAAAGPTIGGFLNVTLAAVAAGLNFPWRISDELLRRHVPEAGAKAAGESRAAPAAGGDGSAPLLEMLRRELDIKNRQIETQNELLKGLSERLREGNILIGSLQQQLALPEAAHHQRPDVVQSSAEPPRAEEGTALDPEKSTKAKTKKRGVFRRLFRR